MNNNWKPQTFEDRRFLQSGDIPSDMIETANKLNEQENTLFDLIATEDLNEAIHSAITESISASYQIEGEYLDSEVIRSFVISSMGMRVTDWMETDWTEGEENDDFVPREQRAVESIMACLNLEPLSHDMIFKINGLACGDIKKAYRNHSEVVRTKNRILYIAPDQHLVPGLMDNFIEWWNGDRLNMPLPIGAAIAHYNFVAIHPFLDGNGRTARALAEKALIAGQNRLFRPYSLASQILREKDDYYMALRTGDPFMFIRYILSVHEKAIEKGMDEARRLGFVRLFLKRDDFSKDERRMIVKMSTTMNFKWKPLDFWFINNANEVFSGLQKKGVITDEGIFNAAYRPVETLCDESEYKPFKP